MNYIHFTDLYSIKCSQLKKCIWIGMFGKLPGQTCLANCQIISSSEEYRQNWHYSIYWYWISFTNNILHSIVVVLRIFLISFPYTYVQLHPLRGPLLVRVCTDMNFLSDLVLETTNILFYFISHNLNFIEQFNALCKVKLNLVKLK